MFIVEKLEVYSKSLQLAKDFAAVLRRNSKRIPWSMADQLIRASSSVPANLAEGNGRWTIADRGHFFRIARGSLFEYLPHLELVQSVGGMTSVEFSQFKERLEEISKMINGLILGLAKRNAKPPANRAEMGDDEIETA